MPFIFNEGYSGNASCEVNYISPFLSHLVLATLFFLNFFIVFSLFTWSQQHSAWMFVVYYIDWVDTSAGGL
jgi:hypothetical protein